MKHFVIVDGYSFLFRAYHAVRPLTRSDGLHTNALYGFAQMMLKVLKDMQPDLCAVALDSPTNFRKQLYPLYKANRTEMDAEMAEQLPFFEPLIQAFGVPALRVDGVEADDIIATLVNNHQHQFNITIVSSDKDLMQLLSVDNVKMFDSMKNKIIQAAEVFEKFGVYPDKVVEVQSLIGDSSDNIPGVSGIGPKTAAQLMTQFSSLDDLYQHLDKVEKEKLREKLRESEQQARLSRQLVLLKRDVPLLVNDAELAFHPDVSSAADYMGFLEFHSLAARLKQKNGSAANQSTVGEVATKRVEKSHNPRVSIEKNNPNNGLEKSERLLTEAVYQTVDTSEKLEKWLQQIEGAKVFSIDTETTHLQPMLATLVGVSLAVEEGYACYIPLMHEVDMLQQVTQLEKTYVLERLKPLLENENIRKVGQNIKYDIHIFRHEGIDIRGIDDTMLMSFCLNGGKHSNGMDVLAKTYLNYTCMAFKDVCGSGQKQITFNQAPIDKATRYAAEDADITLRLYHFFKERLLRPANADVRHVYEQIELPLVPTLVNMERAGIAINQQKMQQLSQDFHEQIQKVEQEIFVLAGEQFNISSPKQLGEILFDKLGLKSGKSRSTNQDVLEKLAEDGQVIAEKVLTFRQLSKLRSTYTEALIQQINPQTQRIHTNYNQAGAGTGRFSSNDPNLQNIPIRSENGAKIREAFVPKAGCVFMGFDYSQIELRLLAHASGSKALKTAFLQGADIHRYTASQIFNVVAEAVTPSQRNIAKTINFGIVYGMGAQAMARQLGIKKDDAQAYISAYFERYDGVKAFMDSQIEFARMHGYVCTMFGRRIHLPDIDSANGGLRAGAERAAINAPLQGANADIIKMVMPKIEQTLLQHGMQSKMLLQVHDELVFEVPIAEQSQLEQLVKTTMETVVPLDVPLKVGVASGTNWQEAH